MDIEWNKNEDAMKLLVSRLNHRLAGIHQGGGKEKIAKLHAKGKWHARERIDRLLDPGSERLEIGAFAGFEMYAEHGGCPSGGVVVTLGYVTGRLCVIVANDATVKAGAWFPITAKKNLRAQEIAMENRLPIIYLVDSAGVYLPMQDEIFPDKEHFGRIFRNNARMSALGIPQIAAIMGSCVAGGAYLPIMSDESIIVEGTGSIFLAGPYLVKAAIGETVDQETLGGATTQTEISGICDHKVADETECVSLIRKLVSQMGKQPLTGFDRIAALPPKDPEAEIYGLFPHDSGKTYDMSAILHRLVDGSELTYYKKDYGRSVICAYARIQGWAVGIVANNRSVTRSGKGEVQIGGVIYSDAADKAARFILNCNQKKIPLVFLHDVTGFMVGSRSEHGGIIKDGAKMVNAVANATVPKFTVIIGNSFGAGNYAMCGKAYDPRLIVAWPGAKIAVMGGQQAARTLWQIQQATSRKPDALASEADDSNPLHTIQAHYERTTTPYYAAARLWVDAIIDPLETRKWISFGIEMANFSPVGRFNTGVMQT
ncbi:MAG: propionyl-CoA carboxylase [Bacteroidota bacterium]|jgi:acetyl-CoA carboxylase carboxyltransferase component